MIGAAYLGQPHLTGLPIWQFDITGPVVDLSAATASRISRISGKDITQFTFTSDEDYAAYQIRAVPSAGSPYTAGIQVESGTAGSAGVPRSVDVTDDELINAGLGEGNLIIKVFTVDAFGNWSL